MAAAPGRGHRLPDGIPAPIGDLADCRAAAGARDVVDAASSRVHGAVWTPREPRSVSHRAPRTGARHRAPARRRQRVSTRDLGPRGRLDLVLAFPQVAHRLRTPRAVRTHDHRLALAPLGDPVDALDLARWQFGITTVYHFIFVPLTIGLAPLVAIMQTAWVRTGNERWLRLTKFFGKLLLINFAIGVATGIVQEFQFGMAWSEYSRFVGDVFGAPLAMEALAAFFVESTFLGLWIFGWDKLPEEDPPRVHLGGRDRDQPVGVLHPRRELVDAAPGRRDLQRGDGPRRDERHRRRAHQPDRARRLPAHDRRRVPHGGHVRRRHRRLVDGQAGPPRRRGDRQGRLPPRGDRSASSRSWSAASASRSRATSRPSSCSSSSR